MGASDQAEQQGVQPVLDLHIALTAQTALSTGKLSHEIREHTRSRDVSPRSQSWLLAKLHRASRRTWYRSGKKLKF